MAFFPGLEDGNLWYSEQEKVSWKLRVVAERSLQISRTGGWKTKRRFCKLNWFAECFKEALQWWEGYAELGSAYGELMHIVYLLL